MQKGVVSVIMAIYNNQDTLRDSIDSIICQTYRNWELIICDDGSTDESYKIAEEYKIKYPNKIFLIKNDINLKLSISLNHCLEKCTGEFIARMDGDDISLPNRFETQVAFLRKHTEYDLVSTAVICFNDKLGEFKTRCGVEKPTKLSLIKKVCFAHPTVMTHKYVYDRLSGYSTSKWAERVEDYELWFRFFEKRFKGYCLQKPFYKIREDDSYLKRKKFKYRINELIVRFNGYRMLKIPLKYYVFIFKPILAGLTPKCIMRKYHQKHK